MKIKFVVPIVVFSFLGAAVMAQDSPLKAAPGAPPPPQGWNQQPQEDGGMHLPEKKKKPQYKLKMKSSDSADEAPEPSATP